MKEKEHPVKSGEKSLLEYAHNAQTKKSMTVKIMNFDKGPEVFDDVRIIRVKGKNNLLIMCDYLSILGEVDGSLEFVTGDDLHVFENLKGVFCHRKNFFTFLANEENI